jgi:hypothetical protein
MTSDGLVTWRRRFILTLASDFDFANLPFDRQVLSIAVESYRLPDRDMVIKWSGSRRTAVDQSIALAAHNPEWCFRRGNQEQHSVRPPP